MAEPVTEPSLEDKTLNNMSDAIILIAMGHEVSHSLDLIGGITHGHAQSGISDHVCIVTRITDTDDGLGR